MLAVRPRAHEAVKRLLLEPCRVSMALRCDANGIAGTQVVPDCPKHPARELRVHPHLARRAAGSGPGPRSQTVRRCHRPSSGRPEGSCMPGGEFCPRTAWPGA